MRSTVLILIFGLLSAVCFAQSNLQFNQAIYLKMSYVLPNGNSYQQYQQTITVPAGKVWKIESASGSAQGTGTNYVSPTTMITLDGINLTFFSSGSGNYWETDFPIWLPAGSYTVTMIASSATAGNTITGRISGIEFNLVP